MLKTAAEMRELSNQVNRHQRKRDDIYQEIETRIYFAARIGLTSCDVKIQFQSNTEYMAYSIITDIIEDLHSKGYIVEKERVSEFSYILFISW